MFMNTSTKVSKLWSGWEGPLRQWGERYCQDRPDHDHGPRGQGRREQVRHDGAQLRGARRSARAHPAGRREGLRRQVKLVPSKTLYSHQLKPQSKLIIIGTVLTNPWQQIVLERNTVHSEFPMKGNFFIIFLGFSNFVYYSFFNPKYWLYPVIFHIRIGFRTRYRQVIIKILLGSAHSHGVLLDPYSQSKC